MNKLAPRKLILIVVIQGIHLPSLSSPLQTQLKDYDRDILQELWRIRNTVQTLREAEKRSNQLEIEKKYLTDTEDGKSPSSSPEPPSPLYVPTITPAATKTQQQQQQQQQQQEQATPPTPPPLKPQRRPPAPPSKAPLMEEPSKSSDDMLLEGFFGTEQMTKLDMFKKQISMETLPQAVEQESQQHQVAAGWGSLEALPRIMESSSTETDNAMPTSTATPPSETMPKGAESSSPAGMRLRLAKHRLSSDANRASCDVASEMEKLRARLQETAQKELAEFDRKFSPKLHHTGGLFVGLEIGGVGGGAAGGNHSRQGSLDSSIPRQSDTPPRHHARHGQPLPHLAGGGHTRQHSLPIDPKFLRQLQQQQQQQQPESQLSQLHQRASGGGSGWSPKLSKSSSNMEQARESERSPTPPLLYGHVRQVSGGSVSSESVTFSPPPTPVLQLAATSSSSNLQLNSAQDGGYVISPPTTSSPSSSSSRLPGKPAPPPTHPKPASASMGRGGGVSSQHYAKQQQQGKVPGLSRMGGNDSTHYGSYRQLSGSSTSLTHATPTTTEGEGQGCVVSNNGNRSRSSSNAQQPQPHPSQTHYSTAVLKRTTSGSKRNSLELGGRANNNGSAPKAPGVYSRYDSKVPNGRPPGPAPGPYEQPKRRSCGEDAEMSHGGTGGMLGGRYPQLSPPRMEVGNLPASPKLSQLPDRRGTASGESRRGSNVSTSSTTNQPSPLSSVKPRPSGGDHARPTSARRYEPPSVTGQEEIEPYMTSSHVKQQIQKLNFNYTPFSQQQQQRSHTVSAADAPRLTKQGGKNTWI